MAISIKNTPSILRWPITRERVPCQCFRWSATGTYTILLSFLAVAPYLWNLTAQATRFHFSKSLTPFHRNNKNSCHIKNKKLDFFFNTDSGMVLLPIHWHKYLVGYEFCIGDQGMAGWKFSVDSSNFSFELKFACQGKIPREARVVAETERRRERQWSERSEENFFATASHRVVVFLVPHFGTIE